MDIDILIPIFWMLIFGSLIFTAIKRISPKKNTKKKWIRPEKSENEPQQDNLK